MKYPDTLACIISPCIISFQIPKSGTAAWVSAFYLWPNTVCWWVATQIQSSIQVTFSCIARHCFLYTMPPFSTTRDLKSWKTIGFLKWRINTLTRSYRIAYPTIILWNKFIHRELPTGKGFADLVLIPRKDVKSPAIIVELKYNRDADSAIAQIHRRQYSAEVAPYADNLLLVGINYDREQKTHECKIELHSTMSS